MKTSHNTKQTTGTISQEAPACDPMQEFANSIIAELENGVKPWVRPWDRKRPEVRKRPSIPSPANDITASTFSYSVWICVRSEAATRAG